MKVSLKWAQQFSETDLLKDGQENLLGKIGSQLGAIDEVINWGERYDGTVVAKIVKCDKHPDADKLSVCLIDDGGVAKTIARNNDGLVQVVCGAPNARATLWVAWIPPGVVVPSSWDKDKLLIESINVRGQVSNGMLASPAELGIGDNHDGILEINATDIEREPTLGEPFKGLYGLDDVVIDIENKMFTHRPDCFGILGVARELAGISHQKFESPNWYGQVPTGAFTQTAFEQLPLSVENKIQNLVPRFLAIALSDIKIRPSPYWLQVALSKVGIKPINNVVDITNFVMHLTGQPLHAFDYDKVTKKGGSGIEARAANEGEELLLLGGKKIKLSSSDMVIAAIDGPAIALAGVMGGSETEVDPHTKNILIECANFDMYAVRRTSMRHGLFTDASMRYTKGQSPLQNPSALAYCVKLLCENAEGKIASKLIDINNTKNSSEPVDVEQEFINHRLGLSLDLKQMTDLLQNVEFSVEASIDKLSITAPFWRTDIKIKEDIVEEVGRLYGYEHLPVNLPKRDLFPASINQELLLKQKIRRTLSRAGSNEVLTYSFVSSALVERAGQDTTRAIAIRNALSPELNHYRMSLLPSILDKIHSNLKAGYDQFSLFEIGRAHTGDVLDEEKLPKELKRVSFVIAANSKSQLAKSGSAYFNAKANLEYLLKSLNIENLEFSSVELSKLSTEWQVASSVFDLERSAQVYCQGTFVGVVGEPAMGLTSKFKLPNFCAAFELDLDALTKLCKPSANYLPINRFPNAYQDICLRSDTKLAYGVISNFVAGYLKQESITKKYGFRVECLDIYVDEAQKHKQTTFRISLWHKQKTLTDEEFNSLIKNLALSAKQTLNLDII